MARHTSRWQRISCAVVVAVGASTRYRAPEVPWMIVAPCLSNATLYGPASRVLTIYYLHNKHYAHLSSLELSQPTAKCAQCSMTIPIFHGPKLGLPLLPRLSGQSNLAEMPRPMPSPS